MPGYVNKGLVLCRLALMRAYVTAVKAPPPQLSAEFQGALGDDDNAPKH
jgi:hypothetical protein